MNLNTQGTDFYSRVLNGEKDGHNKGKDNSSTAISTWVADRVYRTPLIDNQWWWEADWSAANSNTPVVTANDAATPERKESLTVHSGPFSM